MGLLLVVFGCFLKHSELFILFAENSQILKISVIPILLTFIYLVALNLLNSKQSTQLIIAEHNCHIPFVLQPAVAKT